MHTFQPDLDLLQRALGPQVQEARIELIKTTLAWSRVYRVTFVSRTVEDPAAPRDYAGAGGGSPTYLGQTKPESVILKLTDPQGPEDPLEAKREVCFYQTIRPQLPGRQVQVHSMGWDERSGCHFIVMEDLEKTHRFPVHPHQWTRTELQAVLQAYAQLHTRFDPEWRKYDWLAPRYEDQLDFEQITRQAAIVQGAGIWDELPGLPDLVACARQSCLRYGDMRLCLVHYDATPVNAPIPIDAPAGTPATLIDWQNVGLSLPEFDLAYIDLQPFESGRGIPRRELLEDYWRRHEKINADIPSPSERRARQLHADLVTALWLLRPASRVAQRPYPAGTYPRMHWDSIYGILYNRLKSLREEINH